MRSRLLIPVVTLLLMLQVHANEDQPIETGTIDWGRDLDAALNASSRSGKPVFLLFQEVPGCAGCKKFGREVLSNPALKADIETSFVPLLIHNNKGAEDERVRELYREPAWNFQVVRFLNARGKDIIPRKDRVWDTAGIARRMIKVLEKEERPVSDSLRDLAAGGD